MKKEIRCFIVNSHFATPDSRTLCPVYELSEEGLTFSKRKQLKTIRDDERNTLVSFHFDDTNELDNDDVETIVNVVETFVNTLGAITVEKKPAIIANFLYVFNGTNKDKVTDVDYNILVMHEKHHYPDLLSFSIGDLSCTVWLSDESFKLFYPLYDIDVVPPFDNFKNLIRKPGEVLRELRDFNFRAFNERADEIKNGYPSTYTRVLDIPYRPDRQSKEVTCYFGFNIYGAQGDYEHLMREKLYEYLREEIGLTPEEIETHFPSIFKVNEFFHIPDWTNYAIPFKTGQGSINSQISPRFNPDFVIGEFIKAYEDSDEFFKANTYNVPVSYNNLNMWVVNGKYTKEEVQDFRKYYKDMITVSTTHPDFARMKEETQRYLVMLNHMLAIADAKTQTELFSAILKANKDIDTRKYKFVLTYRAKLTYVSIYYDKHRYYMMPRFEFERIQEEINNG